MVVLKADPWRPDHSAGAEADLDGDLANAVVDPTVETPDWADAIAPAAGPCPPATFVDGVMRTELRVMATDGGKQAWGLLGSCTAGAVRCDGTAHYVAEDEPVARALVIGGRIDAPPLLLDVGGMSMIYEPYPVADESPQGLRIRLQRLMLEAEQRLAARLAGETLVFADGPLHLDGHPGGVVVGVVKRMVKRYLETPHADLLPRLRPGERTPLFALGNNVLDRYAWYVRLIRQQEIWHDLAGLVRCEVRTTVGLQEARRVADQVACHLPAFAGRPGVDPRAPQNLTPVGALEARLKHRLGSATLIARALQTHLTEAAAHG
ncbi:MAG: hypothetical protein ABR613_06815 [Actinomycetota bacterium]